MTTSEVSSQPLAGPFRANPTFVRWPAALVVLNLAMIGVGVAAHQYPLISLFGMMALAFSALFLTALTLQVTMSEEGLKQKWIWGWRTIVWHEIASIERVHRRFFGDGLFLLNAQNKEIFAVSALPLADQEMIIVEAVKRARLRTDKKPLKRPVLQRWVRK